MICLQRAERPSVQSLRRGALTSGYPTDYPTPNLEYNKLGRDSHSVLYRLSSPENP